MHNITYTYDPVGNITRIKNSAGGANGLGGSFTYEYSYDDLYRLETSEGSSSVNAAHTLAMAYSPSGNILKKTLAARKQILGNSTTGSYKNEYAYSGPHTLPNINEVHGSIPQLSFAFDGNGNRVYQQLYGPNSGTNERLLCWDEENRLSVTRENNYVTANSYDASSNRAWTLRRSSAQALAGERNWMWQNGSGSEQIQYSYFEARYGVYLERRRSRRDAGLSIWLSVDPMSDKHPHQSKYTYCSNTPVMIYDTDGRDDFTIGTEGNVCFQKKSERHRLHALENFNNGNLEDGVTAKDVNTLRQLKQSRSHFNVQEIGGETHKGSYATSKNRADMMKLFKFASKNSNVEWILESYVDGTNFLGTNQNNDMVGSGSSVKALNLNILDLKIDIHSHPGTSPKDDKASNMNGYGDMPRAIRITNGFLDNGRSYEDLPKFQIFRPHVKSSHFFEYNAWTSRVK